MGVNSLQIGLSVFGQKRRKQIDWQKGKEVNFSEIYRELEKVYSFSASEKRLLEDCKIEEKLWALYLALSKSSL